MIDEFDISWVELFSNRAFVRNLDNTTLNNIFLGQQFPHQIFFSFVHEATHHWCFSTRLGTAAFVLKMRAYLAAREIVDRDFGASSVEDMMPEDECQRLSLGISKDYTRYCFVEKMLQPITEGLAVFAEYDSYPTDSEDIPSFLAFASLMFSGIPRTAYLKTDLPKFEKAYRDFLIEKRVLSNDGVVKKADLLMEGLSLERRPYLVGYLFIKSVQQGLILLDEKFADPNLFMQWIRNYFYNDPVLIERLFDDAITEKDIADELIAYLNMRINTILHLSKKDVPAISAQDKLNNALATLLSSSNIFVFCFWYMRAFFRVTRLNCYAIITGDAAHIYIRLPHSPATEELLHKFPHPFFATKREGFIDVFAIRIPNTENYPPYEGPVIFEKYICFEKIEREFMVLLGENRPVWYFMGETWPTNERDTVKSYFKKNLHLIEDGKINDLLTWFLKKDSRKPSYFDTRINKDKFSALHHLYLRLGLSCEPDSFRNLVKKMEKLGFWQIVNEREDLIRLLALL
ncbi:MAG TPA: hypothetical protein VNU70_10140, partial [Puia sp.]|nr:hypothetical protein [Puia sp.]